MKNQILTLPLMFAAFAFAMIFTVGSHAATFTVNNTSDGADATPGNGICEATAGISDCTLRAAIGEANTLGSDDVINFSAGITAIAVPAQIVINPTGTLTITGLGANILTIDGIAAATNNRIFLYNGGAAVSITDLTLTGGVNSSGGAISASLGGSLTLDRVHVMGNQATFFGGGGVRLESGTNLFVRNSTFSGNAANNGGDSGGAIYSAGTLTIVNTTISGNTSGGGLYLQTGSSSTLRNVTIANNTASSGGGVFINGGVHSFGNTLIANNTPDNVSGLFTDSGGNFVGTATLDPLANYGGPTPTIRLPAGSALIDAGINALATGAGLTTDQRGLTRIADGDTNGTAIVDIGAFEVQATTAASVSVSGRVTTESGSGIRNVRITLTDSNGVTRMAVSSSFGYYRFDDVAAGETYIISASAKRYQFPPQVITVTDELNDVDFTATQ